MSVTVLTTIDYGLSQVFFIHNSGIVFYTTSIILITGSLIADPAKKTGEI
jgi:hypothetical protein